MIPTEAPTGRKLGLQAVRVSANPISLGMEISWDISWDFFGHPNLDRSDGLVGFVQYISVLTKTDQSLFGVLICSFY